MRTLTEDKLENYPFDDPFPGRPAKNFIADATIEMLVDELENDKWYVFLDGTRTQIGPVYTKTAAENTMRYLQRTLNDPFEVRMRAERAIDEALRERERTREDERRRHKGIQTKAEKILTREDVQPVEGDVLILPMYIGYSRYPHSVLTLYTDGEFVEQGYGKQAEMCEAAREFEGRIMLAYGDYEDKFRFERKGKKSARQYKTVWRIKVKKEAVYSGERNTVYSLSNADFDTQEEALAEIERREKQQRKGYKEEWEKREGKLAKKDEWRFNNALRSRYGKMFPEQVKVPVKKSEAVPA